MPNLSKEWSNSCATQTGFSHWHGGVPAYPLLGRETPRSRFCVTRGTLEMPGPQEAKSDPATECVKRVLIRPSVSQIQLELPSSLLARQPRLAITCCRVCVLHSSTVPICPNAPRKITDLDLEFSHVWICLVSYRSLQSCLSWLEQATLMLVTPAKLCCIQGAGIWKNE